MELRTVVAYIPNIIKFCQLTVSTNQLYLQKINLRPGVIYKELITIMTIGVITFSFVPIGSLDRPINVDGQLRPLVRPAWVLKQILKIVVRICAEERFLV